MCRIAKIAGFLTLLLMNSTANADYEAGYQAFESRNYTKAIKELLPMAKGGHAGAQYYMGRMALEGLGTEIDHRLAAGYFRHSAEGFFKKLGETHQQTRNKENTIRNLRQHRENTIRNLRQRVRDLEQTLVRIRREAGDTSPLLRGK